MTDALKVAPIRMGIVIVIGRSAQSASPAQISRFDASAARLNRPLSIAAPDHAQIHSVECEDKKQNLS